MKNNKLKLLLLVSLISLTGCDIFSGTNGSSQSINTNDSTDDITDDDSIYEKDAYLDIKFKEPSFETRKIESKEDVTFDDLFNLGNKVSISVDVSDEQLELLQQDYINFEEKGWKSETYRIADKVKISLVNDNQTFIWEYDQVGIRQKGNTSRKDVFENGEIANLNHFKLSFDETFDDEEMYGKDAIDWTGKEEEREERKDREFLSMSGLDIKWNKNYDSTYIKEIYSSYLYDSAGLMTASIGLTTFSINQVDKNKTYNFGLCTLFEPDSKSFIKRELKKGTYVNTSNWDDEKKGTYGVEDSNYGDFYKASWGIGEGGAWNGGPNLSTESTKGKRVGVGNKEGSYVPAYERKTNDDVVYNDAPLRNLTNAITNSTYSNIEKLIDLEVFAITEACNYYIGNPDDLRNNNNNYTIYFRRTDGKAMIIPIDNDRCFGITKDWNPDGFGMTKKTVFDTAPAGGVVLNNLHKKTILSNSANDAKAIYLNYVKALKVSPWVLNGTFENYYHIASKTYGNDSCKTSFGDGFEFGLTGNGNYSFSDYIFNKLSYVDLNQTIGKPSNSSTNNNSSSETSESNEGYYGEVYLVGSFNSWKTPNKDYPFEYKGNGIYEVTFTAQNVENGIIKWKAYDGNDYSSLDWTCDSEGNLDMEGSGKSSVKIYDCENGDRITIRINTIEKSITTSKED